MVEQLNGFQEYLLELYEEYRRLSKQRNPSDSKFAAWLGVKPAGLNHWMNGYRTPDLVSVIKISQALARHGVRNHMKVFDVLGLERVYVAPNSQLEYLVLHWVDLPEEMKAEINTFVDANKGNPDNGNGDKRKPDK